MWGGAADFLLSSITHLSRWISKAGCVKEGECFFGWTGAIYGNNCIVFDQSVQGSLDIVLKIPSREKCEAKRSSVLERRQVQETFSFQMFSQFGQSNYLWNIQGEVILLYCQDLKWDGNMHVFRKRQNVCQRWMPFCCQFSKEFQMYSSGWVSVISQNRLFAAVNGIKSSCLGSHSGVPQGSVPRLILFCLFIEQFTQIIHSYLGIILSYRR